MGRPNRPSESSVLQCGRVGCREQQSRAEQSRAAAGGRGWIAAGRAAGASCAAAASKSRGAPSSQLHHQPQRAVVAAAHGRQQVTLMHARVQRAADQEVVQPAVVVMRTGERRAGGRQQAKFGLATVLVLEAISRQIGGGAAAVLEALIAGGAAVVLEASSTPRPLAHAPPALVVGPRIEPAANWRRRMGGCVQYRVVGGSDPCVPAPRRP